MPSDDVTESRPAEARILTRRGFLEWLLAALVAFGGLLGLAGLLAYLRPGVEGSWGAVEVARAAAIPSGQAVVVPFKGSTALVIHLEQRFVAFSAACTHAGCLVAWDPDQGRIICPCHLGIFDTEGNVVSGLPSRPLPKLRVEQVGDRLLLAEA